MIIHSVLAQTFLTTGGDVCLPAGLSLFTSGPKFLIVQREHTLNAERQPRAHVAVTFCYGPQSAL